MLGDRNAGRGRQERVGAADVDRRETAAGTAHVGQVAGDGRIDLHAIVPHGAGDRRHLVDGRPLHDQADQKTGDLYVSDHVVAHVFDEFDYVG